MDLDVLFNKQFNETREGHREARRLLETIEAKEQLKEVQVEKKRQDFRNAVSQTHTILKPVLDHFINSINKQLKEGHVSLVCEEEHRGHTVYRYRVLIRRHIGGRTLFGLLARKSELTMFDIFFGYDLYDRLFAVRMTADRGEPLESYTIEDVQAPDIRERFAKDLVRRSGSYL